MWSGETDADLQTELDWISAPAVWASDAGDRLSGRPENFRMDFSAVKEALPRLLHDVAEPALHLHGSIGLSTEIPFTNALVNFHHIGLADGPTEVHKMVVAIKILRSIEPIDKMLPTYLKFKERGLALDIDSDSLGQVEHC